MTEQQIIGAGAALLGVYGYGMYIRDVLRGHVRPHLFTWTVWGILMSIALAAQLTQDTSPGTWNLMSSTVLTVAVAIASLFYGDRNITRGDWIAFIASLSAIPVWKMTANPVYAVLLICAIDCAAVWPTFRKSWYRPHQEGALMFALTVPQFLLSIVALDRVTLVTALYPALIAGLNTALVLMLLWRRRAVSPA